MTTRRRKADRQRPGAADTIIIGLNGLRLLRNAAWQRHGASEGTRP